MHVVEFGSLPLSNILTTWTDQISLLSSRICQFPDEGSQEIRTHIRIGIIYTKLRVGLVIIVCLKTRTLKMLGLATATTTAATTTATAVVLIYFTLLLFVIFSYFMFCCFC
jgi:hypothetical protein